DPSRSSTARRRPCSSGYPAIPCFTPCLRIQRPGGRQGQVHSTDPRVNDCKFYKRLGGGPRRPSGGGPSSRKPGGGPPDPPGPPGPPCAPCTEHIVRSDAARTVTVLDAIITPSTCCTSNR